MTGVIFIGIVCYAKKNQRMCAINGFNFEDKNLIHAMNQATMHRGPDGTGVFCGNGISLGHNRLAIIDTSEVAGQPMKSADGNLAIVFNGEIYNFRELKKELAGYPFKTESDTEVILAAYQEWGKECVKKFNGIFAFAVWDTRKKELFLARDHIGAKPLYYFLDGKRFIFSSEIKGMLTHDIPRALHTDAFAHYVRLLYVPEPLTMFAGIKKLPRASYAILKNGSFSIAKYWDTSHGDNVLTNKRKIEELVREKISQAVTRQLVSDRPLGVYLSGGIDSSIVLHEMSQLRGGIDTFSVGFELSEEEQKEKFNADFNLARQTAARYGTNHHEVLVSIRDVLDSFEKAVFQMDEPISNPTAIAMMKLAGFTKGKADVVLGGDGGDELFGGYERYRLSKIASLWQYLPSSVRALFAKASRNADKLNTSAGVERYALFMFQKDSELQDVIGKDFFHSEGGLTKEFFEKKYFSGNTQGAFEDMFMKTDRESWLADFSLMLTDKMSMSAGLEARVPLLDKELIEFSSRIPSSYKVNPFRTKIILKSAYRGRIPDILFHQPKRGWFSPGAKWLRHPELFALAENILSETYYPETASLFDFENLRTKLKEHKNARHYHLNVLWAILTFQIWARGYRIHV